ncbi:MAG: hypothetical protein O3B01_01455 [Planctomycetota bacterium]|nr:hypothetical protein [Planctomycetota bacterium]
MKKWGKPVSLVAIIACTAGLTSFNLFKEYWYDEAVTMRLFAGSGFFGAFTDYRMPNNHMVFSALMAVWLQIGAGLNLPLWWPRILPWLISAATVGLLFLAVDYWKGRRASVCAALLLACSHAFINFSCHIRGYGLSALWSALGLMLLIRYLTRVGRTVDLILYALVAVLAVGTVPTNLLLFGGLGVWAAVEIYRAGGLSKQEGKIALVIVLLSPALGMVWYLWHQIVRAQFFDHASGGSSTLDGICEVLGQLLFALFIDYLALVPLFLWGSYVLIQRSRSGDSGRTLSVAWFLGCSLLPLFSLILKVPYSRNFFPAFPFWFAASGIILAEGIDSLERIRRQFRWIEPGLAAFLVLMSFQREWNFPAHYRKHFTQQRPQSLYYQYYQVDFHPIAVVKFLLKRGRKERLSAFIDESDPYSIKFHSILFGFEHLYRKGEEHTQEAFTRALKEAHSIYLISSSAEMAASLVDDLNPVGNSTGRPEMVCDTGFFKVYRIGAHPALGEGEPGNSEPK